MMNRPDERTATDKEFDGGAVSTEARENEGLSTADIAGGRQPMKPEDQPDTVDREMAGTTPRAGSAMAADAAARSDEKQTPLFAPDDASGFRSRWSEIQAGFVDDPRHTVEQADGLVAEVMKQLAEVFADERARLEKQWDRGDDVSTEDLRVALQRYRSFFERLLSM
jgi:hypothetical protein